MILFDACMLLMMEYHSDTRNSHSGELYMLHPYRVYMNTKSSTDNIIAHCVALHHDLLEDVEGLTEFVLQDRLIEMVDQYPEKDSDIKAIGQNVRVLTKVKGQSNEDYYKFVKSFPVARIVKLADIKDNFRRNYLISDDFKRERMMKKYSLGMDILG